MHTAKRVAKNTVLDLIYKQMVYQITAKARRTQEKNRVSISLVFLEKHGSSFLCCIIKQEKYDVILVKSAYRQMCSLKENSFIIELLQNRNNGEVLSVQL